MRNLAPSYSRSRCRLLALEYGLWVTISAYGMALTCAVPDCSVLAWVAFVPFLMVLRRSSAGAAIGYGLLWGITFAILLHPVQSIAFTIRYTGIIATGGATAALAGLGINGLARRVGVNPLIFALIWVLIEVSGAQLIPDSLSLAGETPALAQSQLVAVTGFSALSFLIVLVNALLILLWDWARNKLRHRGAPGWCWGACTLVCDGRACVSADLFVTAPKRGPPWTQDHSRC